ncbi:MAG: YigZ family protein [Cellulosilyticaceae bacterium]
MLNQYKTIEKSAQAEIIEKKSRFIANVFPIESQEQVDEYLAQIRKQYYDARHNCFAYQLGERNEVQRFSDDGEPQGTAGKPILDVLKGPDIKNTLIVVTRYFGGTLLGTGGLVRAYGKAAKEGLIASGVIQKVRIQLFEVQMSYNLVGKVQYLLNEKKYTIREAQYLEVVSFTVEVEAGKQEDFEQWLIENTNAEVTLQSGEYDLISVPVQE